MYNTINIHFELSTIHKLIHNEKSYESSKFELCTELSTLSTMNKDEYLCKGANVCFGKNVKNVAN